MKIFFPVLAASLVLMASCNNEKKVETTTSEVPIETVVKTAQTEGKTTVITTAEVPDTVRTSFTQKYPAIEKNGKVSLLWGDHEISFKAK